jgi:hypothetical protein
MSCVRYSLRGKHSSSNINRNHLINPEPFPRNKQLEIVDAGQAKAEWLSYSTIAK